MLTVRLILALCNIHNLESNSIDSVLAFPQADLDVYIWIEIPIDFVIDEVSHGDIRSYVLKLNKNIYGLKQASLNWYNKLFLGLIAQDFVRSVIGPCFYMKDGMVILTYVDDCIIAGRSMKGIYSFVYSIRHGSENYILNDEGDVNKFLGIEITHNEDSSFKLSQPFLIHSLLSLLGLGNNKYNTSTTTPVAKDLLQLDLTGKPRKLTWKYRTSVGIMY